MPKKLQVPTRPICQTTNCNKPAKPQPRKSDGTYKWSNFCSVCNMRKTAEDKGMTLAEYRKDKVRRAAAKAGLSVGDYEKHRREKWLATLTITRSEYYKQSKERAAAKQGMSLTEYNQKQRERVASKLGVSVTEYDRQQKLARVASLGLTMTEYKNRHHPYRKHRKDFCENQDGRFGYRCRYKIRHMAQLQVDHINGNPKDNDPSNLQTLCANCHIFKTQSQQDYLTPGRKSLRCS